MLLFPFDACIFLSTKLFPGYMIFIYLPFAKCYLPQETDIIPLTYSLHKQKKNERVFNILLCRFDNNEGKIMCCRRKLLQQVSLACYFNTTTWPMNILVYSLCMLESSREHWGTSPWEHHSLLTSFTDRVSYLIWEHYMYMRVCKYDVFDLELLFC